jgi:hypothetical protein
MKERAPFGWPDDWQAEPCTKEPHKVVIQSSYGPHDERLVLDGNFGDPEMMLSYAQSIAKTLNQFFSESRPRPMTMASDLVAIPKEVFKLLVNALQRDVQEGRQIRGEMLDILIASVVSVKD